MEKITTSKSPVLIPFVCPVCTGANAVELVILSRAGGMSCVKCNKHLRSADVMRAIHSPRERDAADKPLRQRAAPPSKPKLVWPPTAESRAAVAPLRARRGGEMN